MHNVNLTQHAVERIGERLNIFDMRKIKELVYKAYAFGKSRKQVDTDAVAKIEKIQKNRIDIIALLYEDIFFIFSENNTLITVYKKDSNEL